ncbi:MAG: hypothetical protein ACK4UZ_01330 [Rhizobium rhizophilum]
MFLSKDYSELIEILNRNQVQYMLVGAYAVGMHTEPRGTKDLDIWVGGDAPNAAALHKSLVEFGAPGIKEVEPTDFEHGYGFRMGNQPWQIDILTHISGRQFDDAWPRRTATTLDGLPVSIIGLDDLIANKRAADRDQDRIDVHVLESYRDRQREAERSEPETDRDDDMER